jgi:hypothetical protein
MVNLGTVIEQPSVEQIESILITGQNVDIGFDDSGNVRGTVTERIVPQSDRERIRESCRRELELYCSDKLKEISRARGPVTDRDVFIAEAWRDLRIELENGATNATD